MVVMLTRYAAVSEGLGRHIWYWDVEDRNHKEIRLAIIQYIFELLFVSANAFAKFAM